MQSWPSVEPNEPERDAFGSPSPVPPEQYPGHGWPGTPRMPAQYAQPQYPQPPYPPQPSHPQPPYPPTPYPQPYPPAPYPQYPYPPAQYAPTPGYAAWPQPTAFDPVTGRPLSDKSKVTAGLLQLLLGFLFGLGGVGRLYAGNTSLGVVQIVATAVGWASFICGFVLFVPFVFFFGIWVWFVVDGIVMLTGRPVDGQGRLLRS